MISLDYPGDEPLVDATVRITTAVYGIHHPGTVYRMDEVPIPLRSYQRVDYPTDQAVLEALNARLASVTSRK